MKNVIVASVFFSEKERSLHRPKVGKNSFLKIWRRHSWPFEAVPYLRFLFFLLHKYIRYPWLEASSGAVSLIMLLIACLKRAAGLKYVSPRSTRAIVRATRIAARKFPVTTHFIHFSEGKETFSWRRLNTYGYSLCVCLFICWCSKNVSSHPLTSRDEERSVGAKN